MPSKSKKQRKLMLAVEHNKKFADKVGIPQKVGKEFAKADSERSKSALSKLPQKVSKRGNKWHRPQGR